MAKNKRKRAGSDGRGSGGASVSSAIGEAMRDVAAEARADMTGREEQQREQMGERGRELVDSGAVPAWTAALHGRVGHVGGLLVFLVLFFVGWAVAIMAATSAVVFLATRVVTEIPGAVLSEQGVDQVVATARTDGFVFGWAIPVLFVVAVLALLVSWALVVLVRRGARLSERCARGLFAGYQTSVIADWRELRARRAVASSRRAAARRERAAVRAAAADQGDR